MRLIDADKLCEDLLKRWSIADTRKEELIRLVMADIVTPIIASQPSVEPERKKGKWIVTSEFDDCYYAKCNQCNVTQIFYYGKPLTNYCPDCGSYNGGEQE